MPKESVDGGIQFADTEHGEIAADELPAGKGHQIYQRRMITRWSREGGYVEVGVAKVNVADGTERDPHYLVLTRDALNQQIRALRKARDQAFGADA